MAIDHEISTIDDFFIGGNGTIITMNYTRIKPRIISDITVALDLFEKEVFPLLKERTREVETSFVEILIKEIDNQEPDSTILNFYSN